MRHPMKRLAVSYRASDYVHALGLARTCHRVYYRVMNRVSDRVWRRVYARLYRRVAARIESTCND